MSGFAVGLIALRLRLIVELWNTNGTKPNALANLKKHQVDFYAVYDFEWNTATVSYSEFSAIGESRWIGHWDIAGGSVHLPMVFYVIRGQQDPGDQHPQGELLEERR